MNSFVNHDFSNYSGAGFNLDKPDYEMAFERAVAQSVMPGTRVLEIGSGVGRFVDHCIQNEAAEVVAIEPRRAMMEKFLARSPAAKRAHETGRLQHIEELWPQARDKLTNHPGFDVVFSQSSLHYLESTERINAFVAIREVLNPSGLFALTVRSAECSWVASELAQPVGQDRWSCPDGRARTLFTQDGLLHELNESGFAVRAEDLGRRVVHGYGHDGDWDVFLEVIVRNIN